MVDKVIFVGFRGQSTQSLPWSRPVREKINTLVEFYIANSMLMLLYDIRLLISLERFKTYCHVFQCTFSLPCDLFHATFRIFFKPETLLQLKLFS